MVRHSSRKLFPDLFHVSLNPSSVQVNLGMKVEDQAMLNCQPHRAVFFCSAAFAALLSLGLILASGMSCARGVFW